MLRETRSRAHATRLARRAAALGGLVVAAGGDGTIASVAAGIAGTRARMGIVPLGTANDVAAALGIPRRPADAWRALADARTRRFDLLDLRAGTRRRVVVNMVIAGNGARVTRRATPDAKARWGPWTYALGAASVLRRLRRWDVRVRVDGRASRAPLLSLVLANGPATGGGYVFAPGASTSDGRLDVVTLHDAPRAAVVAFVARLAVKLPASGPHVRRLRARHVSVRADAPLPLAADGDALPASRTFSVRVRPGAVRIALPALRRPR